MMKPDGGKANPRADSFSLYHNWVANRVLMNLLPKSLLDNKLHRTMRNSRKKAIQNNSNNNNNDKSLPSSPSKQNNQKSPNKTPAKTKDLYKHIESEVKKQISHADKLAMSEKKEIESANQTASSNNPLDKGASYPNPYATQKKPASSKLSAIDGSPPAPSAEDA